MLKLFNSHSLVVDNNFGAAKISRKNIQISFNDAVSWVKHNRHQIEKTNNPMLWWMLGEAVIISKNDDLEKIFTENKHNNFEKLTHSPWSYLFFKSRPNLSLNEARLFSLPDYNLHFIYGFSCHSDLGDLDIIKMQNETDFCWKNYSISAACLTHQMMAFRFMQRIDCNAVNRLSDKVETISEFIKFQSIFDFRVVDVYIQRVLMQFESGNQNKINKRWIKKIIDYQRDDGGWADFQPLFKIYGNKSIGYSSKGLSIVSPKSNFHTSIQGIWLMALLLNQSSKNELYLSAAEY